MFSGLAKAVGQLTDPKLRAIVWRSVGISLVVFLALWGLAWVALDWAGTALADWLAQDGFWNDAIEWLVALGGVAAVLVTSLFLFPAVMGLAMGLFLEDAAGVVEARHYPDLPAAEEQPIWEGVKDGVDLAVVTVVVNLIALPVYLLLSFAPPLNLFVFYAINGYLLGREYFEVVAVRRMHRADVKTFRRRYRGRITTAGVAIAIMLTIPVLNLLAPIVATAYMVHVFERLRRRAGAPATRQAAAG